MMPGPETEAANAAASTEQLGRATRFALVCMLLVATGENLRACMKIGRAGRVFEDMLGAGSMLPAITIRVLQLEPFFKVIAFALPAGALALLLVRNVARAIYAAGALLLVTMSMNALVQYALWEPVLEIIRRMQGGAP